MFVYKNFSARNLWNFTGIHIIWLTAWAVLVTCIYEYFHAEWLRIPWEPLSVIGTAVAFYIGFKNNSSYDRMWEARKIWGAIVNSSRMWGTSVKAYVTNRLKEDKMSEKELSELHQRLLYRHIAWLYSLRSQLLIPTSWEHIRQGGLMSRATEKRRKSYGIGLLDDEATRVNLACLLEEKERKRVIDFQNTATQLIDNQSQELKKLREEGLVDDFRHIHLQQILNDFYTHQGKCERIKKFPLPRQYGSMSFIFVGIFIFLLPFGLAPHFHDLGHFGIWLTIPFTVLIGWVYLVMELVGDYSENPFEGLGNDIPMLALCRTIEIDLREMLGETDLPPKIESVNGVLM